MEAEELAWELARPRRKGAKCPAPNPSAQAASIDVGSSRGLRKIGEIATTLTPAFGPPRFRAPAPSSRVSAKTADFLLVDAVLTGPPYHYTQPDRKENPQWAKS